MSKKSLVRWIVLPVTMVAVGALLGQSVMGADASPIAVHMDTFAGAGGVSSFALSMKPTAVAPTAGPRDIVVLFNTSESQSGEYRAKAFDALKGFLAGLSRATAFAWWPSI